MSRIRIREGKFQVLITPNYIVAPCLTLLNEDNLRNCHIIEFDNLRDAQEMAMQYPDIDWNTMIYHHQYIYKRLEKIISNVIKDNKFVCELKSYLLDDSSLKSIVFDKVENGGINSNLLYDVNELISFVIVNPWLSNLVSLSNILQNYKNYYYQDELRIKFVKAIDNKVICMYGRTEHGTQYEIKLMPTLIYQWTMWNAKSGNNQNSSKYYKQILKLQDNVDQSIVLK